MFASKHRFRPAECRPIVDLHCCATPFAWALAREP